MITLGDYIFKKNSEMMQINDSIMQFKNLSKIKKKDKPNFKYIIWEEIILKNHSRINEM